MAYDPYRTPGERGCGPTLELTAYGWGKRAGWWGQAARDGDSCGAMWLNKAGRVLQASGPESYVLDDAVELESSADGSVA